LNFSLPIFPFFLILICVMNLLSMCWISCPCLELTILFLHMFIESTLWSLIIFPVFLHCDL
jgi:hypothetical protein